MSEDINEVKIKINLSEEYIQLGLANIPHYYKRPQLFTCEKTTIIIPAKTLININNKGYRTKYSTSLDVSTIANRAGKDIYIYAVATSSTIPDFVLSLNSTVPDGYTDVTSRKIGGFHCLCENVGEIENHPLSGFKAGDILPASIWDLQHRPTSSPEGMLYSHGKWFDIYLSSFNGEKLVSEFNGATITGISELTMNADQLVELLAQVGKRLPTRDEFIVAAQGSNNGTVANSSALVPTTGGHKDKDGRRMISYNGLEDCCGVYWQYTGDLYPQDGILYRCLVGGSGYSNEKAGIYSISTASCTAVYATNTVRGCADSLVVNI